jgi:hypothetical protein
MEMDLNALANMDMSGMDIELPEDFGERLEGAVANYMMIVADLAISLYGPDPEPEQIQEAAVLAIMYLLKRINNGDMDSMMDTTFGYED